MSKYINKHTLIAFAIFIIVSIIFVINLKKYSIFTVDDAFITWRYGKNFVEHFIWNYNPSSFELVEAYTNPLFAFLSIIPHFLHIDVVLFFKISLMLFQVFYLVRLYRLLKFSYFIPAAILLLSPAFFLHNYGGLETTVFGILVFELFVQIYRRNINLAVLLSILLIFTRPEGIVFSMAFFAFEVLQFNKKNIIKALIPIGLFILYMLFRLYYFGLLLPNTFYIKHNANFSFQSFENFLYIVIPLFIVFLLGNRNAKYLLGLFLGGLLAMIFVYSGSALTMNYLDRFSYHLIIPSFLIGIYMLKELLVKDKLIYFSMAIAISLFPGYLYLKQMTVQKDTIVYHSTYFARALTSHGALGQVLQTLNDKEIVFSFGDAGITAYLSDLNAIDNIGLANRTITKKEFSLKHLEVVKPKICIFHSGRRDNVSNENHINTMNTKALNQGPLIEYAKKNNFLYIGSYYFRYDYLMAVYIDPNIATNDFVKRLKETMLNSKLLNSQSNSVILKQLYSIPFWKFWAVKFTENQFDIINKAQETVKNREPDIKGVFEIYLEGNQLIYYKPHCTKDDIARKIFLYVYPKDKNKLSNNLKNKEMNFYFNGVMENDTCIDVVNLPNYAIDHISTGQLRLTSDKKSEQLGAAFWRNVLYVK